MTEEKKAPPAPPPARKQAPWRVPAPLPGTENTPSCNPNYRRVDPPKSPPAKPA
jgi:hypothetical protein